MVCNGILLTIVHRDQTHRGIGILEMGIQVLCKTQAILIQQIVHIPYVLQLLTIVVNKLFVTPLLLTTTRILTI